MIRNNRQLYDRINELSTMEHEEIFKIIQNKVPFSSNKNGVFLNIVDIDNDTYCTLQDFVTYCITNKKNLDEYDLHINECKQNYVSNLHINLNAMPKEENVNWTELVKDESSRDNISVFIRTLKKRNQDIIQNRKNNTTLFNLAKKKYSKQCTCERQFETTITGCDEYMLKN
jgi:predicted RNA-binding protein with RPS1 domain